MRKNLLRLLRGNISQSEAAAKYGVSQQTWFSWESGRTVPNNEVMLRMEKDYSIPMEVIFFNSFNYNNELKNEKTA